MTARDAVLAAVRAALGEGTPDAGLGVERAYRMSTDVRRGSAAAVDLLEDRLLDYRATVVRCTPDGLVRAVVDALDGVATVVVPVGVPEEWRAGALAAGLEVVVDDPAAPSSVAALDATGAVLTACRVAVAETGTIVLDGAPDQGRRVVTLLPDRHVCVVTAEQVVGTVPEAVAVLGEHPARPLTWISGPSATSDIELVRVEGVHGPRHLRVVLVSGSG